VARRRTARGGDLLAVIAFLTPFLVLLVVFHYLPLVRMVWDSVYDYELLNPGRRRFVGLAKYAQVLTDPQIRQSFGDSLLFAGGVVVLVVPLAFLLALYLDRGMPGRHAIRAIVFLPAVTSVVVVATMWTFLLNPANGLVNSALTFAGLPRQPFLTDARQALPTLVLVMLWQQLGFATVLYLGGLQGIPAHLDDAARIDGASPLQRLWYVTLPLLGRTTVFIVVVMTVFGLQVFAAPMIMTGGGPEGSTNLIVYNIYQTAFSLQDPGLASAMSAALLVIVLGISVIQLRLLRTEWSYS
jgi:multiple sugar transport system permease protein